MEGSSWGSNILNRLAFVTDTLVWVGMIHIWVSLAFFLGQMVACMSLLWRNHHFHIPVLWVADSVKLENPCLLRILLLTTYVIGPPSSHLLTSDLSLISVLKSAHWNKGASCGGDFTPSFICSLHPKTIIFSVGGKCMLLRYSKPNNVSWLCHFVAVWLQ